MTETKELMRQAWIEAWCQSRYGNTKENFSNIERKTAEDRFERWWTMNFEEMYL